MTMQEKDDPQDEDRTSVPTVLEIGGYGSSEEQAEIPCKPSTQLNSRIDPSAMNAVNDSSSSYNIGELPCHPSSWPQRPLMIRPTPNTTTQVMGIRFADESNVIESEGFADSCCLPINGGQEVNVLPILLNHVLWCS
jgi:hypothetical protein